MNEPTQERWTNQATCAVATWLDRHQGRSEYWHQQAQKCREDAPRDAAVLRGVTPVEEAAKYLLSEQLREEITEDATRAVQGPDSEQLEAALEDVNWDEIADHYLERIGAALSPFGPIIFSYTRA